MSIIPNTELEPPKKPASRIWISAVLAVIVLAVVGLFFMRQQSVPPAPLSVKATPSLEKVSSYHLKYKHTMKDSNLLSDTAYYEYWYQSPMDWKLSLTQEKVSKMVQMFNNGVRWFYYEGSGVAFKMLVSDNEVQRDINSSFLPKLGKEYRKTGTSKVMNRDCDVIEGDFSGNRHEKICVNRDTGIMMLTVDTRKGKVFFKQEAVTFEVNKSLPKDTFTPKLPAKTLILKTPEINRGLFNLDITTIKAIQRGADGDRFMETSIQILADQGAIGGARLKQMYEPSHVPEGYKKVFAGSSGEQSTMPDGTIRVSYTGKYDSIFEDYINPRTGDTIILTENADKIGKGEGREMSDGDFRGRIVTHGKPFPYTEIFWQIDGVYLELSATALSEQEIVKVAKSMQLVKPTPLKALVSRKPSNSKIAGKLEFRYISSVKTRKHPNAKYNMNMSKDNDGKETYEFIDSKGKTVDPKKIIGESPLILSEADLKPVTEVVPGYQGNPVISIEFTPEGRKKFADFTKTHIDEYLAIIIDGKILSVPVIRAPILDGKAVIEGSFKDQEAQSLADALNNGGDTNR